MRYLCLAGSQSALCEVQTASRQHAPPPIPRPCAPTATSGARTKTRPCSPRVKRASAHLLGCPARLLTPSVPRPSLLTAACAFAAPDAPFRTDDRARDWLIASMQTLALSSSTCSGACAHVRRLAGCGFYKENERSARRFDLVELVGGGARGRPEPAVGGQGSSQAAAVAPPACHTMLRRPSAAV